MKKESFYAIVIVALLVLNLGTLGYLWMNSSKHIPNHKGPQKGQEGPLRFMADELGLDDAQFKNLRIIARNHGKALDSIQQHIGEARTSLYVLAKDDVIDTGKRDAFLKNIEAYESAKHMITLTHFHDIRSILSEEQKVKFNAFVEDMARHMAPPVHGPDRGRGTGGPPPPRR